MPLLMPQLHHFASLKRNSERDLNLLYKVIAPVFSSHSIFRKIQTQSVGRYMKLKILEPTRPRETEKKLAVILSWLLAKERNLEKYRAIYLSRGFDVLTVHLPPKGLLFPTSGSQVLATSLLDYIQENNQYDKILMHAFSVGAYLMGETFVKMRDKVGEYMNISKRISAVVLDSAVDVAGTSSGVANALSRNPITIKLIEWYISTHMILMHNIATKHYIRSSKNFHDTPLKCPALLYVSEADTVGSLSSSKLLAENWKIRGVDVRLKCFKDSLHVSHLHKYQDEYVKELDSFLRKARLVSTD